ncbi:cyclic AMP-dependent transcription factor ATF-6 alpha isoform X2 [Etheostoma cragini]|uniref:cyclic AMP-dependent transcription factor ATF-6 alpha isoform X2 n=1 Tax=Etheostoma cragini TaxID=417921 RepID=UPI00155E8B9C|nr:cyclic AMP-dependent transcription factor ATF-6 alpha isoform X2 [Etheostoma cragini]
MSTNSMLSFGNHQHNPVMDSETGVMSIDHGGEWDISLFDELDNLGDTDELLQALEHAGYASELDFDIDIPPWNEVDTSSTCTDGEVSLDSLSPAHTLSSVPSPTSVEALSPYFLQDEALSPQSQSSSVSVCSESSGFSVISPPAKKAPKRTSQTARARQAQPIKRPIQIGQRVSIQPKPLITAVPLAHASAPLQAKTIIIQPLQTAVLPVVKQAPINIQPAPINIQPAPPPGHTIVLSQPSQVLQIQTTRAVTANVVTMPTLSQDRHLPVAAPVTLRTPSSDDESKLGQRQQRMIKNRESASLSRKKKKDYLLSLEARLKMALSENEELKSENGTLKKQLEGLLSENTVLKVTAPKRRAVCLMVVLVFVMLNIGPMSLFQGGPGSKLSMQHGGRHLLGFSSEAETEVVMGPDPLDSGPSEMADSSEDKALMVVKDPIFLRPPPPCQPPVNRTKCRELAHELRGWVHRHEVQQTKSRRMSNSNNKPTRTILKTENKEADGAQIVTVQYTETTEEKNPASN